jgi:hypothetical protein
MSTYSIQYLLDTEEAYINTHATSRQVQGLSNNTLITTVKELTDTLFEHLLYISMRVCLYLYVCASALKSV